MSINKDYAQQFNEMGYKRKVIAFKLCNETPENAEDYGEDMSFLCAISAEPWEEGRKPFYITNKNSLCGGLFMQVSETEKLTRKSLTEACHRHSVNKEATNQEISSRRSTSRYRTHFLPSQISPHWACWRISKNLIL